ncbi:MAG: PorV/PorQ family protein [Candidatus Kapabacteria bacterium]|nr:PorV/PorQ family protein [Candidatus Kapabacteria bacterium]
MFIKKYFIKKLTNNKLVKQNFVYISTIFSLPFIFFFFSLNSALSQTTNGGYAESYLLRDVGARQIAMAGAYTAIVNEPMGFFYNPAGLSFMSDKATVATMYSFLEYGRSHSTLAWAQQIYENLGLGFGFNSFNAGTFMSRDFRGNPLGDRTDWQYSIAGAFSYKIEYASFGLTAKYLTNNLVGSMTNGNGFGFDLGMKFNVLDLFSFGVCAQNISGRMYWNEPGVHSDFIPFTLRTGIAMEYGLNEGEYQTRSSITGETETKDIPSSHYLLFALDAIYSKNDMSPSIVLGLEAVLHEAIVFRGGIGLYGEKEGVPQILPMNIWGAGVSIRPELKHMPFKTHFDYSVSSDLLSRTGLGHHLSLVFEF